TGVRRAGFICVLAIVLLASVASAGAVGAPSSTHTLTVKIAGTGSGVIHGDSIDCWPYDGGPVGPCTVTENAGNVVTLTATANKGSVFAGWSGDGCSGTGACTVTLSQDVTVT